MLLYKLNKEQKQIVFLSSMGGLLEFYDFTIYGLFAVYFSSQFFPSHNKLFSIIASYSVFLVGYVIRPLGGILFSHIGDEIGRKTVLILTMVLMGIASMGLGLTPTYAQIGIMAPVLLLLFRLMQGLAIGGELPSMIVYVSESMPDKRGFGMGGIFAGTITGLIPGMLINLAITKWLGIEQINSFGWRIPFIIGGLLCFIAYQVRKKLHETKAFQRLQTKDKLPFLELIRNHSIEVLIGTALVSIMATPITLVIIFMPTYLVKIVGISANQASDAVLLATVLCLISTYIMGILANKYSIIKLMGYGSILITVAAIFCYYGIANHYNLALSISFFAILQGAMAILPPIFLSYLFPVHVRLSGVALAYNISFVLFAGLTPIIITAIIEETHWIFLAPTLWMGAVALITLIATVKSRKYIHHLS